jgi:hypothetical protein
MKTSKPLSGAALALALALPFSVAHAETGTNLNLIAGQKYLDEDDWEPADEQTSFGITVDHEPEGWWLGAKMGAFNGTDTATTSTARLTSDTWEFFFGPNKVIKIPGIPVRVYAGAGYAYMTAMAKVQDSSGTARGTGAGSGYWASTGAFITLADQINLGVHARHSSAEVSINGVDVDAGGNSFGAILGFHF